MLKASDFNGRKASGREKEWKLDCKGVREWVDSEDAETASRKPAGFRNAGVEEERESSRECEGWGKIFKNGEYFSIPTERKQTLFSLLNLCKASGFLPYYAIYPIAFPALVIKENSF